MPSVFWLSDLNKWDSDIFTENIAPSWNWLPQDDEKSRKYETAWKTLWWVGLFQAFKNSSSVSAPDWRSLKTSGCQKLLYSSAVLPYLPLILTIFLAGPLCYLSVGREVKEYIFAVDLSLYKFRFKSVVLKAWLTVLSHQDGSLESFLIAKTSGREF